MDEDLKSITSTPKAEKLFGDSLQTNYEVYRAIQYETPSDIHLLASTKDVLSKTILLTLKGVVSITWQKYEFTNLYGARGFEFMPTATSTFAEVFMPNDAHVTVLIKGATMDEADSILDSLRLTQASSTSR